MKKNLLLAMILAFPVIVSAHNVTSFTLNNTVYDHFKPMPMRDPFNGYVAGIAYGASCQYAHNNPAAINGVYKSKTFISNQYMPINFCEYTNGSAISKDAVLPQVFVGNASSAHLQVISSDGTCYAEELNQRLNNLDPSVTSVTLTVSMNGDKAHCTLS